VRSGAPQPAQVFEIRNIGTHQVRIHSVKARWLLGRSSGISGEWNRTPLLDPDTKAECSVFTSQLITEPPTGARRILPFYRVDFLDSVGREWSAGYRRLRFPSA